MIAGPSKRPIPPCIGGLRRDRMVPLGDRAKAWLFKYTAEARPKLLTDPNDTTLFVSNRGEALAEATLSAMARDYIVASGVNKQGACHIFRHSMATAMLENGADVRFIQAILGHTSLNSTAIYTHVAIRKLVEIHERTHPAAMLKRKPKAGTYEPEPGPDALLDALADEDDDDDGPTDPPALDSKSDAAPSSPRTQRPSRPG